MRAPITYYGGKQNMAKHVLELMPSHRTYVEPFFGGGSIFFMKEPSKVEVINDLDDRLITMYRVMKTKFPTFKAMLDATLHSRSEYRLALQVMKSPQDYSDMRVAWATYIACNASYSSKIGAGWAFSRKSNMAKRIARKLEDLTDETMERLRYTSIESQDALRVIEYWDTPETLFYLDPPYPEGDCGHYTKGKDIYYDLLEVLPSIKGKFILSSYPSEHISQLWDNYHYPHKEYETTISGNGNNRRQENTKRKKVECLTWNFNNNQEEFHLEEDVNQINLLSLLGADDEQCREDSVCEDNAGCYCKDPGD